MAEPEIVLNLWYVRDEQGLIYSLRIRPYVCVGTDDAMLAFLKERASLDYQIAQPFSVPEAFHTTVMEDGRTVKCPVAHVSMLDLRKPLPMYEEALKSIESGFPSQTRLSIPIGVLVCVTALGENPDGEIVPWVAGELRF
jgi:hypothetical protein